MKNEAVTDKSGVAETDWISPSLDSLSGTYSSKPIVSSETFAEETKSVTTEADGTKQSFTTDNLGKYIIRREHSYFLVIHIHALSLNTTHMALIISLLTFIRFFIRELCFAVNIVFCESVSKSDHGRCLDEKRFDHR